MTNLNSKAVYYIKPFFHCGNGCTTAYSADVRQLSHFEIADDWGIPLLTKQGSPRRFRSEQHALNYCKKHLGI